MKTREMTEAEKMKLGWLQQARAETEAEMKNQLEEETENEKIIGKTVREIKEVTTGYSLTHYAKKKILTIKELFNNKK
jgi:hypothetical protein